MKTWLTAALSTEGDAQQTWSMLDKWKDQFITWFNATWEALLIGMLKIILVVIVIGIIKRIVHRMIDHVMKVKEQDRIQVNQRRLLTVGKLMKNVTSLTLSFIMVLYILSIFNINLAPLLAGAGVIGLAISFGAQSLVKDVMTGFFIIFEDQFAVGDVVRIGEFQGTVEMIGLRSTRLNSWTGEVHIIPNGSINQVTNFSLHDSLAVIDVSIAYEENIEKATRVIEQTLVGLEAEDEMVLETPKVLGVQTLGPSEVVIRVVASCKPYTQAPVSRKINLMIKQALDANGIEIPYPRMITYQRQEKGGV